MSITEITIPKKGETHSPRYLRRLQVTKISSTTIKFRYIRFKDTDINKKLNGDDKEIQTSYQMDIEDFNRCTNKYFSRFRGVSPGIYTPLARLRFGKNHNTKKGVFEFDSDLTLGGGINFDFSVGSSGSGRRKSDEKLSVGVGLALTAIDINPSNSILGTFKSESTSFVRNDTVFTTINVMQDTISSIKIVGLTPTISATYTWKKEINFSLMVGYDMIGSNNNIYKWYFRKRPWIGIGINANFNNASINQSKENEGGPQ